MVGSSTRLRAIARRVGEATTAGALVVTLLSAPGTAASAGAGIELDPHASASARAGAGGGHQDGVARRADQPVARQVTLRDVVEAITPPSDRRRLEQVKVRQGLKAGDLEVTARFAAKPTAAEESVLVVYVGTWDGSTCRSEAAVIAAAVANERAGQFADETPISVKRALDGKVLTIRTTDQAGRIQAADWECAFADLRSPDASTDYQGFHAETLAPVYPPRLRIDAGEPVQGNYAGRWTTLRLDVRNASLSDATGVRLRATGKGLKIRKAKRTLGTIDRNSSESGIAYRVRLRGAKARTLTFTATTGGKKFRTRLLIARKPKPQRYASLAGRYFWGFMPAAVDQGWDLRAVWFLNRSWAYLGFPPAGKRPTCAKATAHCKRYTYRPGTGQVRLAGERAKVTTEGFTLRSATYSPTTLARKGQRFDAQLIRNDYSGICISGCVTWTEWLSMTKKGRFVLSRRTIGSIGAPGVGTVWASMPPDEKGTYRVISAGRVELRFADGTREKHTLAIQHDVRGRPSPAGAGLILGDRNFYLD